MWQFTKYLPTKRLLFSGGMANDRSMGIQIYIKDILKRAASIYRLRSRHYPRNTTNSIMNQRQPDRSIRP